MSFSTQDFDATVANSATPKKTFNELLAQQSTKIEMGVYFERFTSRFFPNQDLSFMNYFLELCSEENDGQFIVHHSKLIEYGIVTSTESSDIRKKLRALGLSENEDFEVGDISELRIQGGTSTKKIYHLTPKAFKLCLMRARRYSTQTVDPTIYCEYYLILENVHAYYIRYEKMFMASREARLLGEKEDRISELCVQVAEQTLVIKDQSGDIKELKDMSKDQINKIDEQSNQIAQLLGYAKDTKATAERTEVYAKQTYVSMSVFLELLIRVGTSNTVFKNILEQHEEVNGRGIENRWFPGVAKMKFLVFIGFYSPDDNKIYVYNVARNMSKSYFDRVKQLHEANRNMIMFPPRVISLLGCDVNEESALIIKGEFYVGSYKAKQKLMEITVDADTSRKDAFKIFLAGVDKARQHRFHNYQTIIDSHLARNDIDKSNREALESIKSYDDEFHAKAKNWIIHFALSRVCRKKSGVGYMYNIKLSKVTKARTDMLDDNERPAMLNDSDYALARLYQVLSDHDVLEHIRGLRERGLINDDDFEAMNNSKTL